MFEVPVLQFVELRIEAEESEVRVEVFETLGGDLEVLKCFFAVLTTFLSSIHQENSITLVLEFLCEVFGRNLLDKPLLL